jgi:hypothetical protein
VTIENVNAIERPLRWVRMTLDQLIKLDDAPVEKGRHVHHRRVGNERLLSGHPTSS